MERLVQFAQKVVEAVSEISPFPISLSDDKGYIIGASDPERIGTYHQPSIEVLASNRIVLFTEEKTKQMENVFPGVAVPLTLIINQRTKTVGVLGIIGVPEEVKPYASLVKKYVEMMWQNIFINEINDIESKMLESFMQYILLNSSIQEDKLTQYCEMLHINTHANRFCIIVDIGDSLLNNIQEEHKAISINHMKRAMLESVEVAYGDKEETICSFLNTEKIVCIKRTSSNKDYCNIMDNFITQSSRLIKVLTKYQSSNIQISAGSIQTSLQNIHLSYMEANKLLTYAKKYHLPTHIHTYYDWDIFIHLLPYQMEESLKDKLLIKIQPLLNDENYHEMMNNFMVYCACDLNVSRAAKQLFIHRNTLIYRLNKIERLLKLDMNNFEHCMLLYLVIKNYTKYIS